MSGYPVICDCGGEVKLYRIEGGWEGHCLWCGNWIYYWDPEPEPEPEETIHIILMKDGRRFGKFTDEYDYKDWLKNNLDFWAVHETEETIEEDGKTWTVAHVRRIHKCILILPDGTELGFDYAYLLGRYADAQKLQIEEIDPLYKGRKIFRYKVIA